MKKVCMVFVGLCCSVTGLAIQKVLELKFERGDGHIVRILHINKVEAFKRLFNNARFGNEHNSDPCFDT